MGVGVVPSRKELRQRAVNGMRSVRRSGAAAKADRLSRAVHRHGSMSREGIGERLFTLAFRGMVYPQIWEDPVVDLEAMALTPDCHIVAIASGGCNIMSYLCDDPAKISAVDLNRAHIPLNRLKLAAVQHLPTYDAFYRFCGTADDRANVALYRKYIEPHLDEESKAYWHGRDLMGRRRINFFSRNVYRYGLLGTFIGASHALARLHGRNPARMLEATSLDEQREIYGKHLAPLFEKRHIRWLVNTPVALYGLGIPPAQYKALLGNHGSMAEVLDERLRRLATEFPLEDNYFAWQAFGRRYPAARTSSLPPYLQPDQYETVRARAERISVQRISFTEFLANQPPASADRYVLLDAQDWMTDEMLTGLWREITRTAKPGARVIFRTAGEPTILPGRVPTEILGQWDYRDEESKAWTRKDRSSIYGGFHLYVFRGPNGEAPVSDTAVVGG